MIKELENDLKKVIEEKSDLEKPEPDSKFHKHRDYLTYGLSASEFRSVMKNFDSRFRELPLEDRFKMALKLAGKHILFTLFVTLRGIREKIF